MSESPYEDPVTVIHRFTTAYDILQREAEELRAELRAVYRLLDQRHEDLIRCPKHPKGERCALPVGHDGGCKWASGD